MNFKLINIIYMLIFIYLNTTKKITVCMLYNSTILVLLINRKHSNLENLI